MAENNRAHQDYASKTDVPCYILNIVRIIKTTFVNDAATTVKDHIPHTANHSFWLEKDIALSYSAQRGGCKEYYNLIPAAHSPGTWSYLAPAFPLR